jgi:hypothetical protein
MFRVCVIGAGPAGLAMTRRLLQAGICNVTVYDRQSGIGGNWTWGDPVGHSSNYETVRSISSRNKTAFEDMPFPPSVQFYPTRAELLHYLQSYATKFELLKYIRLQTEVVSVTPSPAGGWVVKTSDEPGEHFDAVCVCNGHHWDPMLPDLPGNFSGTLLHSHSYKSSVQFAGQRVLVIGCGNSGADIAVDLARRNAKVTLAVRRGYHVIPRILFGMPSDVLYAGLRLCLPHSCSRRVAQIFLHVYHRILGLRGLPAPDHPLFATHPLINSELLPCIRDGGIRVVGPIKRVMGQIVHFADDQEAEVDTILACTGFRISFPFLGPEVLGQSGESILSQLLLRVVHKRYRGLYFVGLIQPSGSIWPIADLQARLVAAHMAGRLALPEQGTSLLRGVCNRRDYVASPRHLLEVDAEEYKREILGWLRCESSPQAE